jgi:hypothetical protein
MYRFPYIYALSEDRGYTNEEFRHGSVLGLSPTTLLIYNIKTVGGTKPCRWEHCEVAKLRTRTEVSYDHAKCKTENRARVGTEESILE